MTLRYQNGIYAINYKERSGTVSIAINIGPLIAMEGKNIPREDLLAYAKTIDYKRLKLFYNTAWSTGMA